MWCLTSLQWRTAVRTNCPTTMNQCTTSGTTEPLIRHRCKKPDRFTRYNKYTCNHSITPDNQRLNEENIQILQQTLEFHDSCGSQGIAWVPSTDNHDRTIYSLLLFRLDMFLLTLLSPPLIYSFITNWPPYQWHNDQYSKYSYHIVNVLLILSKFFPYLTFTNKIERSQTIINVTTTITIIFTNFSV